MTTHRWEKWFAYFCEGLCRASHPFCICKLSKCTWSFQNLYTALNVLCMAFFSWVRPSSLKENFAFSWAKSCSLEIFQLRYSYLGFLLFYSLWVFHRTLSDSKSHRVSSILLIDFNNALVWMVSILPPVSNFSNPFSNPSGTVQSAPTTIGITITPIFIVLLVL